MFSCFFFYLSLIHTAQKTIMPFDRLVRSTLGLCDSFTPGDCCGDGHVISTFYPPDTQKLTKDSSMCIFKYVCVSVCVVEEGYIVGGRVLLFLWPWSCHRRRKYCEKEVTWEDTDQRKSRIVGACVCAVRERVTGRLLVTHFQMTDI